MATILAVAGSRDTVAAGAGLLAVYSLGLGLPFIAAAAAIGPFMRASTAIKKQFGRIEKTVGVLLVGDRNRLPHRRISERIAVADRDLSAVRAGGVRICHSAQAVEAVRWRGRRYWGWSRLLASHKVRSQAPKTPENKRSVIAPAIA